VAEALAAAALRTLAEAETKTVPGTARTCRPTFREEPERFFGFGRLAFPGFFTPTAPQRRPASRFRMAQCHRGLQTQRQNNF
jgi:hypothetical protein